MTTLLTVQDHNQQFTHNYNCDNGPDSLLQNSSKSSQKGFSLPIREHIFTYNLHLLLVPTLGAWSDLKPKQ